MFFVFALLGVYASFAWPEPQKEARPLCSCVFVFDVCAFCLRWMGVFLMFAVGLLEVRMVCSLLCVSQCYVLLVNVDLCSGGVFFAAV